MKNPLIQFFADKDIQLKEQEGKKLDNQQKIDKFIIAVEAGNTPDSELLEFIANGLKSVDASATHEKVGGQFKKSFGLKQKPGGSRLKHLTDDEIFIYDLKQRGVAQKDIAAQLAHAPKCAPFRRVLEQRTKDKSEGYSYENRVTNVLNSEPKQELYEWHKAATKLYEDVTLPRAKLLLRALKKRQGDSDSNNRQLAQIQKRINDIVASKGPVETFSTEAKDLILEIENYSSEAVEIFSQLEEIHTEQLYTYLQHYLK